VFPVGNFEDVVRLECAIIGLVLGLGSGILTSVLWKLRIRGRALAVDAMLGAAGAVITTEGLWRMGSEYNFGAGLVVAIALPALHHGFERRHLGGG